MLSVFFGLVVVAQFLCIDTYVHILVTNPEMEVFLHTLFTLSASVSVNILLPV